MNMLYKSPHKTLYSGVHVGPKILRLSRDVIEGLKEMGCDRVFVGYDADLGLIRLTKGTKVDGFKLGNVGVNVKLSKFMPTGRYLIKEAGPRGFLFEKQVEVT